MGSIRPQIIVRPKKNFHSLSVKKKKITQYLIRQIKHVILENFIKLLEHLAIKLKTKLPIAEEYILLPKSSSGAL